jgi:hypothetical protein
LLTGNVAVDRIDGARSPAFAVLPAHLDGARSPAFAVLLASLAPSPR